MANKILAAVDGSEPGFKALRHAIDLAHLFGGELFVLYVVPDHAPSEALLQFARCEHLADTPWAIYDAIGDGIVGAAESDARGAGVERVTGIKATGDPARAILDHANRLGVDMIVLGSRGLGELRGLLLGSVSLKVSSHARCTCVVVR